MYRRIYGVLRLGMLLLLLLLVAEQDGVITQLLLTCISFSAATRPGGSISDEHQHNLGEASTLPPRAFQSRSANLLGSWSAMPPRTRTCICTCTCTCAYGLLQFLTPLGPRADWRRWTRRSGPGATA
ncbi:hypothetical protein V8C37DRAFT_193254 [Trichoderma ceciliae]